MGNFKEDIASVKAFVFDVDGVFTDGKIMVTHENQFYRTYNAKDGFAIKTLTSKGYKVAVISGGKGDSILHRFKALGVSDIYTDCFEKLEAMQDFMAKHNLEYKDILFMGDDVPDIRPMQLAGVSACPAYASNDVKRVARYVSGFSGGEGCVRDIVEQVLRAQNNWAVDEQSATVASS